MQEPNRELESFPELERRKAQPEVPKAFENAPGDVHDLLPVRIKELGLRVEGSPVERYIEQLFRELDAKGIKHFRPGFYLTSEWGCPSEQPVIGVPFYLADRRLGAIESAVNDLEREREIMMYMRHEAGHAFNYAYELYKSEEWHEVFGPFRRPYRERYSFVPFSKSYVRHIAGWYAQKHPDEDFAETFAVWLTPGSKWRQKYANWPVIKKLRYRHSSGDEAEAIADLPLDTDLDDIFAQRDQVPPERARKASDVVLKNRREIVDKVTYWTGARRSVVKTLVEAIASKLDALDLVADSSCEGEQVVELTVYVTTLSMNFFVGRRTGPKKSA